VGDFIFTGIGGRGGLTRLTPNLTVVYEWQLPDSEAACDVIAGGKMTAAKFFPAGPVSFCWHPPALRRFPAPQERLAE
jgi:hypothetical protein